MLQQTLVATVIPFFERFLAQFPTISALAAADEQAVLRLWEGLGYYRRARDLHRAAKVLVSEHEGQFPCDPAAAARLPGIGRYMMGAILSQAFDMPLPILEANSQRVLCRLFARPGDPRTPGERKWLWETAQMLVPKRRAGDFNQSLMELGALICTPRNPDCSRCPIQTFCQARERGLQDTIPPPPSRKAPRSIAEAAIVLSRRGQLLVTQRPGTGRWANMWEFPHGELCDGEKHEEAAARLLDELTGMKGDIGDELLTIKHIVTHHQITLVCFEARYRRGRFVSPFYQKGLWVEPSELAGFPVSSPQRRLAQFLLRPDRQKTLF